MILIQYWITQNNIVFSSSKRKIKDHIAACRALSLLGMLGDRQTDGKTDGWGSTW